MKIVVASDHRGFQVKGRILAQAAELGHETIDMGPTTLEPKGLVPFPKARRIEQF